MAVAAVMNRRPAGNAGLNCQAETPCYGKNLDKGNASIRGKYSDDEELKTGTMREGGLYVLIDRLSWPQAASMSDPLFLLMIALTPFLTR